MGGQTVKPNDQPSEATTATIDAVFEKGTPVVEVPPATPIASAAAGLAPAQSDEQPPPTDPAVLFLPRGAPPQIQPPAPPAGTKAQVGDYVRELGQEYQEQQEEGKVRPHLRGDP
jgi:hypothetical protein